MCVQVTPAVCALLGFSKRHAKRSVAAIDVAGGLHVLEQVRTTKPVFAAEVVIEL